MIRAMIRWNMLLVGAGLSVAACKSQPAEKEIHVEEPTPGVVVLDSLQLQSSGLEYVTVQRLPPDTLHLTGVVTYDAARVSHVGPRMQGRIQRVDVEIGNRVRARDTLAVLDSPELGAAQATWFAATVELEVSRRNHERAERLYRDGIVSERRRLETEGEFRKAQGRLVAAERTLAALGADPDSSASSRFVLRSPLTGIVVDKHATVGEVVGSDALLFTTANLARVWILLDVYEADLARVAKGAPVLVSADASYPDRRFEGRVSYVGAIVDTTSRTVKVRVEIPNQDRALKPGMFAQAQIVLVDGQELFGIPQLAVQTLEGSTTVFVPEGSGRFRVTHVVTGEPRAGGWVAVLAGLASGDTVVGRGSFSLKAELMKASFGEGGHE